MNDTIKGALRDKDDPKQNLRRLIEKLLRHVIKHKLEISILNREDSRLSEEQKDTINRKRRIAFSLIKNELSKLEKQGKIKTKSLTTAIFIILSMTTWFMRWYNPDGPMTLEEIADEMAYIFLNGILKEPEKEGG